jgi:hypothetical protein
MMVCDRLAVRAGLSWAVGYAGAAGGDRKFGGNSLTAGHDPGGGRRKRSSGGAGKDNGKSEDTNNEFHEELPLEKILIDISQWLSHLEW